MREVTLGSSHSGSRAPLNKYTPLGMFSALAPGPTRYLVVNTPYGKAAVQLDSTALAPPFAWTLLEDHPIAYGQDLGQVTLRIDEESAQSTMVDEVGHLGSVSGKLFIKCIDPKFGASCNLDIRTRFEAADRHTRYYTNWEILKKSDGDLRVMYKRGDEIMDCPYKIERMRSRFEMFMDEEDALLFESNARGQPRLGSKWDLSS